MVPLPCLEVVGIVGGSDFNNAGAELGIGHGIGNDRDLAIHQRQADSFAVQMFVSFIIGIDDQRGIAEHGFRARRGNS